MSVFLSVRLSVCPSEHLYLPLPKGEGNAAEGSNFASISQFSKSVLFDKN